MTLKPVLTFAQLPIISELKSEWKFKQIDSVKWYGAIVPGCVHTDLLKNKLIPDPYYRTNEKDLQWIDKKKWVYKSIFSLSEEIMEKKNILLSFKGLDTYAKVFLNNVEILNTNNMFREWTVECKKLIKDENELIVEFDSPIEKTIPLFDSLPFHYPATNDQSINGGIGDKKVSIFTRKAGFQYGWDWGPRFVTSGIWKPIYIIAYDKVRQTDFCVTTNDISIDVANLTALISVETDTTIETLVDIWADDELISSTKTTFEKGLSTKQIAFSIKKPRLWWCNGLGQQSLYTIKCIIKKDHIALDRKELRTGIRTIELIHEKDSIGKSFYIKLNDVPIFMKGANYIPLDLFPSRVTNARYEKAVQSAVDANMNMLRVWGGGIYENDAFYNLCDEKGILIWQDFMFACSLYPGDDAFLDNVRNEITDNVKRLRSHPSIALWCGNNEINTAWYGWGWKEMMEKESPEIAIALWNDYNRLFNTVIPEALKKLDNRFYWPSSPMASIDQKAGDLSSGDIHYWEVWHAGKPFKEYGNNVGRFMSEYGFQSFPEMKTIEQYTLPSDRTIESEVMTAHQRHPNGNQLIKTYLGYYYNTPKDFDNFLYVGQLLQAEGIKYAIEAHRTARPWCMGTLYWQLNDCWPVASWSSTDYYGKWKALHYFVKKAYSPLLLSATIDKNTVSVSIVSDQLKWKTDSIECKIIDFDGKTLWTITAAVTIKPNGCTKQFFDFTMARLNKYTKDYTLMIITVKDDPTVPPCYVYFTEIKDLKLLKPSIWQSIIANENGYSIKIGTNVLAKNVYLQTDIEGFFSDNYFDLLPGETKTIDFVTKAKTFKSTSLKIRSLVDSY